MTYFSPVVEHDAGGMASLIRFVPMDFEPDFTCRWLCPLCHADTMFGVDGGETTGGYCGRCGQRFKAAMRDRSPLIVRDGRVITPARAGKKARRAR